MTISIDDRQLVESYQAGDTDAFAQLVRGHGPSLLGHAIRKLGDRAAAEDAVQETFVRAYRALPRFDGDYRLGPWLHRILANVCADEGNRRRREAEKFDRFAADPFAADLAPGVEDELGLDLDATELADALQSLPPSYREVLNLRFVQELPYDEVARVAGVSEENARARVSRARSAARSALRGVAAIPAMLVPALRRSETVAAAATHGDSMRVATEAAVASAPAATPLLTKAVIGLSVVAAVAAPSARPLPDDAPRAVGSVDAATVAEVVAGEPAASPTAGPTTPGTVSQVEGQNEGAETGTTAPPATPPDAVALPAPVGGEGSAPGGSDPDPQVVPPPVVVAGGQLTLANLFVVGTGVRVPFSADAALAVRERSFTGQAAGHLGMVDTDQGLRSFTLEVTVVLGDGKAVDLRIEAWGTPVLVEVPAEGVADDGVEPTTFELVGSFRATSDKAVSLLRSGLAVGTVDLAAGRLTVTLSD